MSITDNSEQEQAAADSQASEVSPRGTGLLAIMQSVAAAGIGVQSSANRERDFRDGKAWHFVVAGIVGTVLFLFLIYLFVRVLIATS